MDNFTGRGDELGADKEESVGQCHGRKDECDDNGTDVQSPASVAGGYPFGSHQREIKLDGQEQNGLPAQSLD